MEKNTTVTDNVYVEKSDASKYVRPFKYEGKNFRYSANCSIFYVAHEVIIWDEEADEQMSVFKTMSKEIALAIMNGWKAKAPLYIRANVLGVV